jgi:CHAD domain-containing protein
VSEYRFREDEGSARGARRIALGRAESALGHLRGGEDPVRAVHEARKDLKKLRSLLRLVRGELGRKAYRRENERFREAGRMLSDSRDATVRLETVSALGSHYGSELPLPGPLTARLGQEARRHGGSEEATADAAEALAAGVQALEALPLGDEEGFGLLAPGLERSYRRGRRAYHRVLDQPVPDPVEVHEWRKRVKDLWYHLRLLRDAWPAALEGPEKDAHALADLLGDHHDLTVLRAELAAEGDEAALDAFAERRQEELLAEAIPLARRLYAEKPSRYVKRLGSYWDAWQRDAAEG